MPQELLIKVDAKKYLTLRDFLAPYQNSPRPDYTFAAMVIDLFSTAQERVQCNCGCGVWYTYDHLLHHPEDLAHVVLPDTE